MQSRKILRNYSYKDVKAELISEGDEILIAIKYGQETKVFNCINNLPLEALQTSISAFKTSLAFGQLDIIPDGNVMRLKKKKAYDPIQLVGYLKTLSESKDINKIHPQIIQENNSVLASFGLSNSFSNKGFQITLNSHTQAQEFERNGQIIKIEDSFSISAVHGEVISLQNDFKNQENLKKEENRLKIINEDKKAQEIIKKAEDENNAEIERKEKIYNKKIERENNSFWFSKNLIENEFKFQRELLLDDQKNLEERKKAEIDETRQENKSKLRIYQAQEIGDIDASARQYKRKIEEEKYNHEQNMEKLNNELNEIKKRANKT